MTQFTVDHLSAFYGPLRAVNDLSIGFEAGSRTGIFGHNGSGKSTLLDEPSAGLAPVAAAAVLDRLRLINERFGTTVILVEQNVLGALGVVERAVVLRGGAIVYDGRSSELRRKEDLWSWF